MNLVLEKQGQPVRCNVAVLLCTRENGKLQVVLQENTKHRSSPQWTAVEGDVTDADRLAIVGASVSAAGAAVSLPGSALDHALAGGLAKQFEPELAYFAQAALRNAVEEVGAHQKEFIYNSVIQQRAILGHVNRTALGISNADRNVRTELFILDFGNMPGAQLLQNLKASGPRDYRAICVASVTDFATQHHVELGWSDTIYAGMVVSPTVEVIAKALQLWSTSMMQFAPVPVAQPARPVTFAASAASTAPAAASRKKRPTFFQVDIVGNQLGIDVDARFTGDLDAAIAEIREFCKKNSVIIVSQGYGGNDTLIINGKVRELTPYGVDVTMMLGFIQEANTASAAPKIV